MPQVTEQQASLAITQHQSANPVSGTIEVPFNLRDLAAHTAGQPPVMLHAFRTTGEVIREAETNVFWQNDKTLAFVVDRVPSDVPTVLAATIEPGIVLRAIVPPASPDAPAKGQVINAMSETMVQELTAQGVIPPVGVGGIGSVVAQGGLDPLGGAEANDRAATLMEEFANTDLGKQIPEAKDLANSLRSLAGLQREVGDSLAPSGVDGSQFPIAEEYRVMATGCQLPLICWDNKVKQAAIVIANKMSSPMITVYPSTAKSPFDQAMAARNDALSKDVPKSANLKTANGSVFVPKVPVPYVETSARSNLTDLYEDDGPLVREGIDVFAPNGSPFEESEILRALDDGQGLYRKSCSQVSFDPKDTSCRVIVNPTSQAREVMLTRKAQDFESMLLRLEAALKANDNAKVQEILTKSPALADIAVSKPGWGSPIGTWRIRIVQDSGNSNLPEGFSILSDAQLTLEGSGASDQGQLESGSIVGALSTWLPNAGSQRLDEFAVQFQWDNDEKALYGRVAGAERLSDGTTRVLRNAEFDGIMVSKTRIQGEWQAVDDNVEGRFEMVRGTDRFSLR